MREFLDQIKHLVNWGDNSAWISQVFIVIFVAFLLSFFLNKILTRVEARLQKTENKWDDAVIIAFRRPVKMAIWILGVLLAAEIVYDATQAPIFEAIDPIREVSIILLIAWGARSFVSSAQETIHDKAQRKGEKIDRTTSDAIANILKVSITITAVLIILQTLGISISGVIAFGGMGGIAIGFAAKDLLANFFGALMIYFDKPFKIGDWIKSPDRNIEGTVEKIGWRLTVVRTFDKRPLYVPNSVFSNIVVENPSRMSNRRIYETIGVRYEDMKSVEKIVSDIKSMLEKHDEIDAKQTLIVNLVEFNASSVDLMVYTFTKTTNWIKFHEIKQDIMLKIADIVSKNKAEIAFPTQTLHIESPELAGLGKGGK